MSNLNISKYSDIYWFIIRPANGGVVSSKDQLALGIQSHYCFPFIKSVNIHFRPERRAEVVARLKKAKLSQKMVVTEITDAQFGLNGAKPETIAGTGFYATQNQLAESFTIG